MRNGLKTKPVHTKMIEPDGTSLAKVHHDVGPFVDKGHVAQRRLGNGHERQDHHNGEDEPREGIMLEVVHSKLGKDPL